MATADVNRDELTIRLRGIEILGALRRRVRIPRAGIVEVRVVDEPYKLCLGIRAPGLSIPGRRRVGVYRGTHGKAFVAAQRGHRGLDIVLDGQTFDRLLLSVDDPEALATQLQNGMAVDLEE